MGVGQILPIKHRMPFTHVLDLTIQKIMLLKESEPLFIDGQVFIASPYDPHHDGIYKELKSKSQNYPFSFIRADDKYSGENLKKNIDFDITQSEFTIAFISTLNSNVMYELGLAHGMGKKVIIVKDEKTKINANLSGMQHLSYERDLLFELVDKIFNALSNFKHKL